MIENKSSIKGLPTVSILVLTYNSVTDLKECLDSLLRIEYPPENYEILIVDNCSKDDTVQFVNNNYPQVKTIVLDANYGFAKGNNLGACHATGEYIAFLNPDTKVERDWLIELVNGINLAEGIVAVGSKVLFFDDPKIVQVAGSKMCLNGNGLNIGYGMQEVEAYNVKRYILAPPGCSMLVAKDVFFELGGFDPDFFMYVEEFDFGYRLWLHGYKAIFMPSSVVYHRMGDMNKFKISPLLLYNEEKNCRITMIKNFEVKNVIIGFTVRNIYTLIQLSKCFVKREYSCVSAMIQGNIDFFLTFKFSLSKRREIQQKRRVSDKDMFKQGLISSLHESILEYNRTKAFR